MDWMGWEKGTKSKLTSLDWELVAGGPLRSPVWVENERPSTRLWLCDYLQLLCV